MNRVDRLLGYLLLFQSRGLMRARDFAQQFEISERTVYRDIQALSEVGVPIASMPGEGYQLMEGYYLPPITFSPSEARSLFLAVSMLTGLTTEGHTQTAAFSALEKIRAILPQATRRQVEALQAILRFYAFATPPMSFDDPVFVRLQEAIHQQQVVTLHYHALHSNEVTIRNVEPMNLVFVDKAWLLSAYCRLRQAQRHFHLERIDHLQLCEETFTPHHVKVQPPKPGPVKIVVCFDNSVVRWVKERQHFSFTNEQTAVSPTEHTIMVYQLRSFQQIEGWLLSWGDKMELLEPLDLRQQLSTTAARIANRHQAKRP